MARSTFWHTTCSALIKGAEPEWAQVFDYRQPLMLLVSARYSWLPEGEQEDLVQDILLEIKEKLFSRYNSAKGSFRAYLSGVVRNKVLRRWQERNRHVPLDNIEELPEITTEEGAAVDVVADLLGALRRWHDNRSSSLPQDLTEVYVLAGRLVRGETYKEIAKREGLSRDAVKRILQNARNEIMADLLEHTLPVDGDKKVGLDWERLGETARDGLARPRHRHEVLAEVAHEPIRRGLEIWLEEYEKALRHLPGGNTREGEELKNGLKMIFSDD